MNYAMQYTSRAKHKKELRVTNKKLLLCNAQLTQVFFPLFQKPTYTFKWNNMY